MHRKVNTKDKIFLTTMRQNLYLVLSRGFLVVLMALKISSDSPLQANTWNNLCGGGESMLALAQLWWPVSRGNGGSFLPVPQKLTNERIKSLKKILMAHEVSTGISFFLTNL
jgi:hypothetical protein